MCNLEYYRNIFLTLFSPAISFESVQSFIEGGDEPVPKLPDRLVGVKRYAISISVGVNLYYTKTLSFYNFLIISSTGL